MKEADLLQQINTFIRQNNLEDRITSEELRTVLKNIVTTKAEKTELTDIVDGVNYNAKAGTLTFSFKGLPDYTINLVMGMLSKGKTDNLTILNAISNPEEGWAYIVEDQKDLQGNSYIYRYDAAQKKWINTYLISFGGDYAEKGGYKGTLQDLDDKVKFEITQKSDILTLLETLDSTGKGTI